LGKTIEGACISEEIDPNSLSMFDANDPSALTAMKIPDVAGVEFLASWSRAKQKKAAGQHEFCPPPVFFLR